MARVLRSCIVLILIFLSPVPVLGQSHLLSPAYLAGNATPDVTASMRPADEAQPVPATMHRLISLHLDDVTLREAIAAVAEKAGIQPIYGSHQILSEKRITLIRDRVSVIAAFNAVIEGTGLTVLFSRSGRVIIADRSNEPIKMNPISLDVSGMKALTHVRIAGSARLEGDYLQTGTIAGTVVDASTGESLPGVNVVIVGTQQGSSTDAEGAYEITGVEEGVYDVRASFIGFTPQIVEDVEVIADETVEVDFALRGGAIALDEIVAVGYGTQRREDLTAAVSSVSSQDIADIPTTGIDEALTGKVAGMQIQTNSGVPGGGPSVRIRGVASIGAGNEPLYVVDGFPIPNSSTNRVNPLNSIPPQDIRSIEVLKDASATAIYGSRGSNGVILITTKDGTQETRIEVNSAVGVQNIRERGIVDVLNAQQFAQFMNDRISDQIRFQENREPQPEDIPEMYRNPDRYDEGTNWPSELMRQGVRHNYNVSISGGNQTIRSRVSAGITDEQGTLLETGYRRYTFRANIDGNLSNKLSVGLNVAPSLENQQLAPTDGLGGRGGAYASAFLVNPIQPVRAPDGSLTRMVDGPGILPFPNPVYQITVVDHNLERSRLLLNAFAEYELLDGLNVRSTFNTDWSSTNEQRYEPTTLGGGFSYPPQPAVGVNNSLTVLNWLNENTIDYATEIGNHSLEALAGFTIQEETAEIRNFQATDYPDDEVETFNAAQTLTGSTSTRDWGLLSALLRFNYSYAGKYLLTGTVRQDGSSRFGADNKWGTFPSFSVGWRVSGENFMNSVEAVNNLMIRFGYGQSGNFSIGDYRHLGIVDRTDYVLNDAQVAGRSITNLGNSVLGWEEVNQTNIGVDLSMFNYRLDISADVYRKISSNMLLEVETPYTSGFSSALDNRGEVTNKGVELAVSALLVNAPSLSWGVDVNFSRNVNKVTSLDSPIFTPASTAQHITEEGYPIGMFYGFVVEGFYDSWEEIENHIPNGSAIPGAYRHKDVNGDGQITPVVDFERIGNPWPDFTWGLTSTADFHGFDMSLTITGSHGGQTLQTGFEDFYNLDGVFNVHVDGVNRWRSPEDPGEGRIPRVISRVIHRYNQSVWVLDNSYVWIRDLTLGHTFDANRFGFINSVSAEALRVYLNIHNLWISNTNFQNPEESLSPNNPLAPRETRNLNYPISRAFTVGLNLTI